MRAIKGIISEPVRTDKPFERLMRARNTAESRNKHWYRNPASGHDIMLWLKLLPDLKNKLRFSWSYCQFDEAYRARLNPPEKTPGPYIPPRHHVIS